MACTTSTVLYPPSIDQMKGLVGSLTRELHPSRRSLRLTFVNSGTLLSTFMKCIGSVPLGIEDLPRDRPDATNLIRTGVVGSKNQHDWPLHYGCSKYVYVL